ncbi:MAG TPA: diguanylate cyclase [Gammaproteobacteria bacterium]|nr:diguanylate cyclase [Gammaproteobacteria bacterium]
MSDTREDWPRVLEACVEQAYNAVVITDARLDAPGPEILYVNPAFERMTGYASEEVTGLNPRLLQGPDTDRGVLDQLRRNLEAGLPFEGHTVNYRKDGSPFHLEWSVAPVLDDRGGATHYVSVQRDISRQVELEAELEYRASTDPLTGLYNRIRLSEYLAAELNRLRRYGGEASLLLLDLDHFKAVNDEHGHDTGDRVLRQVCRVLESNSREADLLARWGGEELVLLAPETFGDEGRILAEKLRQAVANHPFPPVLSVTVSIGCITLTPYDTPNSAMRRADDAMYAAKAAGRNRVAGS